MEKKKKEEFIFHTQPHTDCSGSLIEKPLLIAYNDN